MGVIDTALQFLPCYPWEGPPLPRFLGIRWPPRPAAVAEIIPIKIPPEVTPVAGKAYLAVATMPVSGEVFVNGASSGYAPVILELDPGSYSVSFGDVAGYSAPGAVSVTLSEGEAKQVTGTYTAVVAPAVVPEVVPEAAPPPLEPVPAKVVLRVDTTPVKGDVYLRHYPEVAFAYQGKAPVTLELDPGTYLLSFGPVEGYETPGIMNLGYLGAGQTKDVVATYTPVVVPTAPPPPVERAIADIYNCTVRPSPAIRGQPATAYCSVKNVGPVAGTISACVHYPSDDINWRTEYFDPVSLSPGESRNLSTTILFELDAPGRPSSPGTRQVIFHATGATGYGMWDKIDDSESAWVRVS